MQSTSALTCYASQADRTRYDITNSIVLKIDVKTDGGALLNADIVTTNLTAVDNVPSTLGVGKTD